ncbi:hypothetical protein JAAARDRAFT_206176 [Jaapia argillacea MUCL 33604]|uniref:Xylose isomerase-like TIM barrel domain-containing protein n=1 Tax=Jaapia argillacea MUCL 33604 TaxID=933084 RepID=A0A067PWP7_9AGAM|nr:hypothetical protein JAAARDRAFT_206176 [Jaapia argillacea MUCL 33604]
MSSPGLSLNTATYATVSAGLHPSHTLPSKLKAIAEAGFRQVELGFPDLQKYAKLEFPEYKTMDFAGRGSVELLYETAKKVRAICRELGLEVFVVHPFLQFETFEEGTKRENMLARARVWFNVLKALDCRMMQVGSASNPAYGKDLDAIANDFRLLADEAASQDPPLRVAYEAWAWAEVVNTWELSWEVVKKVDRENFGLCLDTFHICARAYADPTSPSGLLPSASERLASSLTTLTASLSPSPSKIFYLQVSDACLPPSPSHILQESESEDVPVLFTWSKQYRPLPFMGEDYGGYLPVVDVVLAVMATGWRGAWSYEVFYGKDMGRDDPDVPKRWATAGWRSQRRIIEALQDKGYQ